MTKKSMTSYFSSILIITIFLLSTFKSAQALTTEEILRLLGLLGRYADDINRTFPSRQQPAPQVLPSTNPFNPEPDNSNPSPFNFPDPQPR
jgi:hypothetical protein